MGHVHSMLQEKYKEEKIIRKAKEFVKSNNSNICTMHAPALSILIKQQ